jgi:hypothetical protein
MVDGFGERKTPASFVQACDKFIYTEILRKSKPSDERQDETQKETKVVKTTKQLREDSKLVTILKSAVEDCSDDDG